MTTVLAGFVDGQLRQALGLHQAQRLAEAETLYRQVLAVRPDFAEVHVNCALAQLGQGKRAEAEGSLRRALAVKPDFAKAHCHLGDVLSSQERYREAAASYRRAVQLKPDYLQALNNLGNALVLLDEIGEAAQVYQKAIALRPDFAQAHNNLGHVRLRQGGFEDARAHFARAIALAPNYAEAHVNLGNALHQLGRGEEAQAAFRTAIGLAPNHADAHINLSASLFETGRTTEAEAEAANAVHLAPAIPEAHNAWGNALREQGRLTDAERCYREALRLKPDYTDGIKHLAMVLEEYGRLDDAFALFRRHAELVYGKPVSSAAEPPHKQRHDAEQRAWLGPRAAPFFIAPAPRLSGPAVNPQNDVAGISARWRDTKPQIAVVDNLLTVEALAQLRGFCLESTIWRKVYDGGYLGAFPEHGFAAPLIAQIAEELRGVYPAIIGDHPLLHFWAFKYDSGLNGIKKHADFAAVNVNFWITPDEANLDPEHGGLVVWDAAAPLDWDFAKYNAADDDICAYLARHQANPIVVPYRANRAVIFDSDLFHETDVIRFKPGYENRRINVTLLYGRRQSGPQRSDG
ncbi:MAG TPA: tetratricopeptide repeat protein [Rhizomicrobium sp.]|nr:tetratricopeptide repeat protein [Rhizomicrobium sp.]